MYFNSLDAISPSSTKPLLFISECALVVVSSLQRGIFPLFCTAQLCTRALFYLGWELVFSSFHTQQKKGRSQRFNRRKYFISLLCTFVSAWCAALAHCTSLYSKTSNNISGTETQSKLRKNCGNPSLWLPQTVCALSLHAAWVCSIHPLVSDDSIVISLC